MIKRIVHKIFKTHYIFEFFFLLTLVTLFILESTNIIVISFSSSEMVEIIITLLPTIITIISISLSMANEKILNLKRHEFSTLLSEWYYNFLVMIIDVVTIFVFLTIFKLTNANLSIMVLESISIFYAIYFSVTEIPILLQNDTKILGIIKRFYHLNKETQYDYSSLVSLNNKDTAINYLLFTKGLKVTYNALKIKENDPILLDDLLNLQNKYLFDSVDDSSFLKLGPSREYKGLDVDLINVIESCFSGLEDLLSFSKDFNIYDIYGSEDKTYLMTRCLFCLHKICTSFDLELKEKSGLNKLLFRLVTILDTDDSRNRWRFSFLNSMMSYSLPSGDLWFARALRDYDYPGFIFSLDNNILGFFYIIFCFYLCKVSKHISKKAKADLLSFVNESSKGLNSDGLSWKQYAEREIEYCHEDRLLSFIISLLKIYNSSNGAIFYIYHGNAGFIGSEVEDSFDEEFLINVWLEIILFSPHCSISEKKVFEMLESLSEEYKHLFVNALSNHWIIDNELLQKEEIGFLSFIGIEPIVSQNYGNKGAIQALSKFRGNYLLEEVKKKIENEKINNPNQYIDRIKEYFFNGLNNNLLIDKTISLKKEKKLYISMRIPAESMESVIKQYERVFEDFFYNHIRQEIIKTQKPAFFTSNYILTKEEAEKVLSFKPNYMTSGKYLFCKSGVDLKYLDRITHVDASYLPRMLFWKKKGITANFEYDDKDSQIRPLNDNEINYIIDNEYTMVNGLYKYGRYGKDDVNSILISREALYGFISKTIYILIVVFKAKVKIEHEKVLWIQNKKDN